MLGTIFVVVAIVGLLLIAFGMWKDRPWVALVGFVTFICFFMGLSSSSVNF